MGLMRWASGGGECFEEGLMDVMGCVIQRRWV